MLDSVIRSLWEVSGKLFIQEDVQVLVTFHPVQVDLMKKIHILKSFSGCFFQISCLCNLIKSNHVKKSFSCRIPSGSQNKSKTKEKVTLFLLILFDFFQTVNLEKTTDVNNYDCFLQFLSVNQKLLQMSNTVTMIFRSS